MFILNKKNPWIILGGIIILTSIIFTMWNQKKQNTLELYDEQNVVSATEITTEEKNIETFIYENSECNFTMEIPAGWEKVIQDGCDTYIHTPSSSSIQIQIFPYDAAINNTSQESVSTEVVQNGYTLVSYNRISSSSYELMYQKDNTYDYIEEVKWSKDYIVKLVCVFNDENYTKVYPYYEKSLNSFQWNTNNIIPDELCLYYSSIGDFEFAVPIDWTLGTASASYVAVNSDNTAQLTVTVSENQSLLSDLTATDITNFLITNKNAFMLREFSTDKTSAKAVSSYNNGNSCTNKTFIFANGKYWYCLQFDYITGSLDESMPDVYIKYFREFVTKKIIDESNTHTETDTDN